MSEAQRRLAAIMFTDMVGYTALGQRNESLSLALVEEQRKLIRPILGKHHGREVKTMGDAFLVEFPSALDAVRCAYDVQRAAREFNISLPDERRVHLRVGIHLGDVVESQGDISGDAVNVASRIEPLAEDGGICLTRQVYDHVRNKFDLPILSLGTKSLKNVSSPQEIFKMLLPWEEKKGLREHLDPKRIAVLPFANMSPDPNDEYFADGMTEELITSLSGVKQLTVLARTSVMKYKGSQKGAADVGRELNAGTLIEGSVRKAGNRVRVSAQLIDTESEGHVWAQNYDRQLEDVFAIQSEIAEIVAGELRIRLLDSEKRTLEKIPTSNTEAYALFLQGRELVREETEPSLKRAVGILEEAARLDPLFARANSMLGDCLAQQANMGYEPFVQTLARARVYARRATDIDPELAEAHSTLALIHFIDDDFAQCEIEARRAIELNPSLPEPYRALANVVMVRGEGEEVLRLREAAYRLDPVRPAYIEALGASYFYLGRETEAIRFWEKTEKLAPAGTYRIMTEYYLFKGDNAKANEYFSKAEELEPKNQWITWMRGFVAARTGDKEKALKLIKEIGAEQNPSLLSGVGFIHYALGDIDSYFTYINKALEQQSFHPGHVMYCPLFAKARLDPRYAMVIDRIRRINDESSRRG